MKLCLPIPVWSHRSSPRLAAPPYRVSLARGIASGCACDWHGAARRSARGSSRPEQLASRPEQCTGSARRVGHPSCTPVVRSGDASLPGAAAMHPAPSDCRLPALSRRVTNTARRVHNARRCINMAAIWLSCSPEESIAFFFSAGRSAFRVEV